MPVSTGTAMAATQTHPDRRASGGGERSLVPRLTKLPWMPNERQ